jgi:2-oxoglutarate/2-oxoacid ferredoxin oxidoreductase subunit beta
VRRRINMLYIVANNGTYGLTKGQLSATADLGSKTKSGEESQYDNIDLATLAIELGASFVARSFSGDKHQLVPLIQAGLSHKGFDFIDIISPCVTFNNTDFSTHGYKNTWENYVSLSELDFVPMRQEITTSYAAGKEEEITLHDGSVIHLHKTGEDYDPYDKENALHHINVYKKKGKIATGLLYINQSKSDLHELQDTVDKPFNQLSQHDLCPGSEVLMDINETFR